MSIWRKREKDDGEVGGGALVMLWVSLRNNFAAFLLRYRPTFAGRRRRRCRDAAFTVRRFSLR